MHIWFQLTGVWQKTSFRRQPENHLVVIVMGDHKAEPSLQNFTRLSDKLLSHNMYECFMNTEYLCACMKKYIMQIRALSKATRKPKLGCHI